MTFDLRILELPGKGHVATKILQRCSGEDCCIRHKDPIKDCEENVGAYWVEVTSVLFGIMLCLADACLTLEEDGCSPFSFILKCTRVLVLRPMLLPVCLLEQDSGLDGPLE